MKAEYFELMGAGGTVLPAAIWKPAEIRALLLVAHGTTEHIGRYDRFADAMAEYGVAVAGFDLRGHGHHPVDPQVAAFVPGDWEASVEDVKLFRDHLSREFPGVPLFLLGFSLGSFLIRDLVTEGCRPDGVVLVGTGYQPHWLLSVMRRIVAGQIRKVGFDRPSPLVRQLSFGVYNDKFKPNRTEVDWLSTDEGELDGYLADPLVHRKISAGLFWELLGSMQRHSGVKVYDSWDKDLPILLISGSEDPVGGAGRGVTTVRRQMEQAGMQEVSLHLIPGARHAILLNNAGNAMQVIGNWLAARCCGGK